jgi:hypothetical protein
MNSFEKKTSRQIEKGPNTVQALREWVRKDSVATSDDELSAKADPGAQEEYHSAPRIQDLFDGPEPVEPKLGDNIVAERVAAPHPPEGSAPKPQHIPVSARSSVTRRLLRKLETAVLAIILVGGPIALLANKGVFQSKQEFPSAKSDNRASMAALPQYKLDTLAKDVAAVRQIAEQISASGDKNTNDIATLRAAQQDLSEQMAALAQAIARLEQSTSSSRRHHPARPSERPPEPFFR